MIGPLESWSITPACRANRGHEAAWDEAVSRLRQVYDAQVERFGPAATLKLSITRERAEGIPAYVYDAAARWRFSVTGRDTRRATYLLSGPFWDGARRGVLIANVIGLPPLVAVLIWKWSS